MARNWSRKETAFQKQNPKVLRRTARAKREGLRLLCAGLIFFGCWFSLRCVPGVRARVSPVLENLLSCSCDFEEAVRCFSAQVEGNGDVGTALEDFCVTAFAVQPTAASGTDASVHQLALREALAYPETLSAGY